MSIYLVAVIVLALGAFGFVLCRARAIASADGDSRRLHSLPFYYGAFGGLNAVIPGLGLMLVWLLLQPMLLDGMIRGDITPAMIPENSTAGLIMSDVRRIAGGLDVAVQQGAMTAAEAATLATETSDVRARLAEVGVALGADVRAEVLILAQDYRRLSGAGFGVMKWAALALALAGLALAYRLTGPEFRARNAVEAGVRVLLIAAASIAILTTLGIILSMIFETRNFFQQYSWTDFFFGLNWAPSFSGRGGASELGMIPLLWGTLYVSFIALLVAVPIGLYAAIYMSEYATPRFRAVAKPVIEVLAGIPTIVYGLFALVTVGPLLRDYFAAPMGLGNGTNSVMTAGLVMGIMLIPFVSSLSDDIINAVPQAMRDGSLGLGATHSETVRNVVIPAALPGIVGAILLAASRAIGETMIVVLGAGAAAKLNLNPFEAMTTVTVKIVSQLTGDTDFASPETLVAFALGITLFVMTLGLNVLALYIVRKYREQYE